MIILIVSGFRNASEKSRLADRVSATIGTANSAIRMSGGHHQSVEEHQGCCNYK